MKKILTLLFVLTLSGCASYGYYSDSYPVNHGSRYTCWQGVDSVTCYDNYSYRYFSYMYGHPLYSYWRGYVRVRPNVYYIPPRSSRPQGGIVTPRGYKAPAQARPSNNRPVRPRTETPRPRVETRRPPAAPTRPQTTRPTPPRSNPPATPPVRKVKPRGGGNN